MPKKVDVYRNLRSGGFSIREKGKVISVEKAILLSNAKFIVSKAGRSRVLKNKQRNVHAIIRGFLINTEEQDISDFDGEGYYNPYKNESFIDKNTGNKLTEASLVFLHDKTFHYKKNN